MLLALALLYDLAPRFAVVQAAGPVQAAATSATVTLGQPTGAGNTLVACVNCDQSVTNPSVSGVTLGGTADNWKPAIAAPGADRFGAAIWYDPGCTPGQATVLVSVAGGSGTGEELYVSVFEVAGVLVFDKGSGGNAASGASAWTSGATVTTAQAAEIFFGVACGSAFVPTVTGVGGWTTQQSIAGTFDQVAGYRSTPVAGAAEFAGTQPPGGYTALVATFGAATAVARSAASAAAADTSSPSVTDPRDGSRAVTGATSSPAVS